MLGPQQTAVVASESMSCLTVAPISFVQRFGGALNLHPHVHSLVPDGLFVPGAEDLRIPKTRKPL